MITHDNIIFESMSANAALAHAGISVEVLGHIMMYEDTCYHTVPCYELGHLRRGNRFVGAAAVDGGGGDGRRLFLQSNASRSRETARGLRFLLRFLFLVTRVVFSPTVANAASRLAAAGRARHLVPPNA